MARPIYAWHFAPTDRRLRYDDGREIKAGAVFTVDCGPVLCKSGLHASRRPLDALQYAPGPIVSRVILRGKVVVGDDKIVATEREHVWVADASYTLRHFARLCALDVIHLWDAPDVVIRYLKTGDESLRDAARAAAGAAAGDAARAAGAAWAAAYAADAARAAAWAAAGAAGAAWAAWIELWDRQNRRLHRMLLELGRTA